MTQQHTFIMFENGKSKTVEGRVFANGFVVNQTKYSFFDAQEFLYGDVLFLNRIGNQFFPILPLRKQTLPAKTQQELEADIKSEIDRYKRVAKESEKMIKSPPGDVHVKIEQFKKLMQSARTTKIEEVYYTQEDGQKRTQKVIKNQKIKVSGKQLSAKVDTGANIAVIRNLPSNATPARSVYVRSTDSHSDEDLNEELAYMFPIEINGRMMDIEAIHRPSLPHEILITTTILALANVDLHSIIEEVPL